MFFVKDWLVSIRQARARNEHSEAVLSASNLLNLKGATERRPVFIVGAPRSGTTFLGAILNAAPGYAYYFEPPLMKYLARLVYEKSISEPVAHRCYRTFVFSLEKSAPQPGQRFTEKTPRNIFVVHTLAEAFPNAQFLYIYRDGRDATKSLVQKPWYTHKGKTIESVEPGGYAFGPNPHFYIEKDRREEYRTCSDIQRCAWIWRRHAEAGLELMQTMSAERVHSLAYESLVTQPYREVEKIFKFLNDCNKESLEKARSVACKAFTSSIGTWQELNEKEKKTLHAEIGPLLKEYCYI